MIMHTCVCVCVCVFVQEASAHHSAGRKELTPHDQYLGVLELGGASFQISFVPNHQTNHEHTPHAASLAALLPGAEAASGGGGDGDSGRGAEVKGAVPLPPGIRLPLPGVCVYVYVYVSLSKTFCLPGAGGVVSPMRLRVCVCVCVQVCSVVCSHTRT